MGRFLSFVFATALVAWSSVAHADGGSSLGDDEIRLKGGGMIRGTIVTVEPGTEATIIVKGKEKTIPWSKIEKVEQGKYKDKKSGGDEEEEEEEQPKKKKKKKKVERDSDEDELTEPEEGAPAIHIVGTQPGVQLTKIVSSLSVVTSSGSSATGIVSRPVCSAPCDKIVDGRDGSQFFFSAPGMVASSPFSLSQYDGEIEARVRGGSAGMRIGGIFVTSLGITGVILGPTMLGLEAGTSDILGEKPNYVPGAIVTVAGVAVLAGGIYMLVASKTTFEIRPRDSESAGIRIENGVLRF